MPYLGSDGEISVRVYGEVDPSDPTSDIVLRRQWQLPDYLSEDRVLSLSMTYDGWLIMVTQDGYLLALSTDFSEYQTLELPRKQGGKKSQDFFSGLVRNGVTIDDQGGIYIVTRDHMHRVQWTGNKLSLDPADGAWQAPYPNTLGNGSGSTPGLMGWGGDEDHLVAIADAEAGNNNMLAFWRDEIPEDWQGLPGHDRRIAGITPIRFNVSEDEQVVIENSPVIYGYGAFFDNTYPVNRLPQQETPSAQWIAESLLMNWPGHEARGGAKLFWDPIQRELKTAWSSSTNFVSTVCTVSGVSDILYCWGARNKEWTLEGINWHTGENAFHYTLGESHRFNPFGGVIVVSQEGTIDCGCSGGMGLVRINPAKD